MKRVILFLFVTIFVANVYAQSESNAVLYIDCKGIFGGHHVNFKIDSVSMGTLSNGVKKIAIPAGLVSITFDVKIDAYTTTSTSYNTISKESTSFTGKKTNSPRPASTTTTTTTSVVKTETPVQKYHPERMFSHVIDVYAEAGNEYVITCIGGNKIKLLDNIADVKKITKIQNKYGSVVASNSYFAHLEKKSSILAEQKSQQSGERAYSLEELQALGVIGGNDNANETAQAAPAKPERILSDVDQNIPETNVKSDNTLVLIIANEDYQEVDKVDFALNDGNTFKEYCIKTLGVPEKQIFFYENASYGNINSGISKMVQAMTILDKPNAIVYYCGHGIPDEKTGDAYIIPIDGNGKNMVTCYSLNKLYQTLSETNAANVTYFMDACFTGASKDGSMLVAARGVAREPKKETLAGNAVVFSATSSDETAMAYKEKQHGLFTYFLLKKLQETKGDVSYEELSNYINTNVKKEAFFTNEKPQTPVVATSPAMQESWKSKKLK